jgi:hypothetical protein
MPTKGHGSAYDQQYFIIQFMKHTNSLFLFCLILISCDNTSGTKHVAGDSSTPATDSILKEASSNRVPSDTTNTSYPSKNWSQQFLTFDMPANSREITWLRAGAAHCQNKKLAGLAKKAIPDFEEMNASLKNYVTAHRDMQIPPLDQINTVNIGDRYGIAWDRSWMNNVINDEDSLIALIKKSSTAISDTALQTIIQRSLPTIEADRDKLKQLRQ